MKNAARQLSRLTRAPPTSAPTVKPPDSSAPLRPRTRARVAPSVNVVVSSDRPAGIVIAVAKPCSTRAVRSIPGPAAKPPSNEAPVSRAMPDRNSRRRPNRSANRPNRRAKPAAGSAYAEVIQGSPANPNPTPAPTSGNATFRIEKSTDSMNPAPSSTSRITRCRRLNRDGEGVFVTAGNPIRASVSSNQSVAIVWQPIDCVNVEPGSALRARLGRVR